MIVHPDFLTHWKTRMLVAELNDNCAPIYLIALWGHCHKSRTDYFTNLTGKVLKSVCEYSGDGEKLLNAMIECGFIDINGTTATVHDWSEVNTRMVASWHNGKLGGRPRETQAKPNNNPQKPVPRVTRLDKTRQEEEGAKGSRPTFREWMEKLSRDPAYQGIDVPREYAKMTQWCIANRKVATERRFINWLNRADKPLKPVSDLRAHEKKKYIPPAPIDNRTEEELAAQRKKVREMSEQLRNHLDCVGKEGCKAATETAQPKP